MNYFEASINLEVGQQIVRQDLIRQLIKIQFERTPGELVRGKFRVRGDMFEIMPASDSVIYRIELADQKVATISIADILTRKIKSEENELIIFPPKHFISTQPQIEHAIKEINAELKDRLKFFEKKKLYLEAERLQRRTKYDMEMLHSLGYCHGIENYSRHLAGKLAGEAPDTLFSYFPKDKNGKPDFTLIMDESHIGLPQVRGMYEGDKSRKEMLIQYGWRMPSALDNRPLKFIEFEKLMGQTVFTSATPSDWEIRHSSQIVEQVIRPTGLIDPEIEVRPVFNKKKNYSQIDDIIMECKKIISQNVIASEPSRAKRGNPAGSPRSVDYNLPRDDTSGRVIINTLTKKQAEDLHNYLEKKGMKSNYMHSDTKTFARTEILMDFRRGKFNILIGVNLLREGLDLPEVTLVAILDADREGFLRSETSLIQIMGRAARNVSGKVILYADNITGSIERAMREVNRRRKVQMAYNKKHGITPKSISKIIENLLDMEEKKEVL